MSLNFILKLFKKIDINKIKNPITLLAAGFLFLMIIIVSLVTKLQNETYRFSFACLSIVCFSLIVIKAIAMTESLAQYGKSKIDDPIKNAEKRSKEMERDINVD